MEITLTIGLTTATHQSKIPLWSLSAWTPLTACYKKRLTAQMTITQGCRGKCFPVQYSDGRRVTSRRSDRWASLCITSWTWRELSARSYSGTLAVIWAPLLLIMHLTQTSQLLSSWFFSPPCYHISSLLSVEQLWHSLSPQDNSCGQKKWDLLIVSTEVKAITGSKMCALCLSVT